METRALRLPAAHSLVAGWPETGWLAGVAGDWVAGGSLVDGWLDDDAVAGLLLAGTWVAGGSLAGVRSRRSALDSTSPGPTVTEPCSRWRSVRLSPRRSGSMSGRSWARAGVALAAGVASAVGRAMTVTESPPAASVPTTTAWFLWGDWMIDRGRAEIATGFACLSRTGAQSGF